MSVRRVAVQPVYPERLYIESRGTGQPSTECNCLLRDVATSPREKFAPARDCPQPSFQDRWNFFERVRHDGCPEGQHDPMDILRIAALRNSEARSVLRQMN